MKSKTSFFNKTIFLKNLKRFWLIPAFYLFGMIWIMPVTIYISGAFGTYRQQRIASILGNIVTVYPFIGMIYAVITGMITTLFVFSYIQHSASVNFYHSLPVNRKELFFTNSLSVLAINYAPVIIAGLLSLVVTARLGINAFGVIMLWFLETLVFVLFFSSFAILCMIISGQTWFAGTVYTILNAYIPGMIFLMNGMVSRLTIGYSSSFHLPDGIFGILSPCSFFSKPLLNAGYEKSAMKFAGPAFKSIYPILIEGIIFIVINIVVSYYLYQKRKSESAGDTVAFGFAKPVFRWGFAVSFAVLFTCLMVNTLSFTDNAGSKWTMIVFLAIFGCVGFIVAQMLIRKTVHVMKGLRTELGIFVGLMILSGIVISGIVSIENRNVPDPDEISQMWVYSNLGDLGTVKNKDLIREFTGVHQDVIDEFELVSDFMENGYRSFDDQMDSIYVDYTYFDKNGNRKGRNYTFPENSKAYRHFKDIYYNSRYAKDLQFGELIYGERKGAYIITASSSTAIACTKDDVEKIYHAVMEDFDAGRMYDHEIFKTGSRYEIEMLFTEYVYTDDGDYYQFYDDDPDNLKNLTKVDFDVDRELGSGNNSNMFWVIIRSECDGVIRYHQIEIDRDCTSTIEAIRNTQWYGKED